MAPSTNAIQIATLTQVRVQLSWAFRGWASFQTR